MNVNKPTNDLNDFRIEFCERLAEIQELLNDLQNEGCEHFMGDRSPYHNKIDDKINFLFSILHDEAPK